MKMIVVCDDGAPPSEPGVVLLRKTFTPVWEVTAYRDNTLNRPLSRRRVLGLRRARRVADVLLDRAYDAVAFRGTRGIPEGGNNG